MASIVVPVEKTPMRVPLRRSRPGAAAPVRFHALAALFLLAGLLAPLAPVAAAPAAAQRGADPPPLPAPSQVAAVGSFQTALGCPADDDPSCPLTQLAGGGDGVWSAVLPIPPGDYTLRIATDGGARTLGRGGDPDGADLSLSVPAAAAGAYVAYDALTGQITAEPVAQRATLVTDLGDEVALAPAAGGGYAAAFDAQPGSYGVQILFDDQPVAQDAIALDAPSRVTVAVDDQGNVTLGTVPDTVLDVAKIDDAGSPLPGACFAVRDPGGALAGQACDAADGEDGSTRLRFPNGLPAGTYALEETATPDGQPAADEQRIELGPGRYDVEAVVGGAGTGTADGAVEEETPEAGPGIEPTDPDPTEEPAGAEEETPNVDEPTTGRLVLRATDQETGDTLPGACFALAELGVERCDDDADGDVVFDGVAAGSYTLSQTAAPEGYRANADAPIEVETDGARLRVPHRAAGQNQGQGQQDQPDGGIAPVEPDEETPEAAATEEPAATEDAGRGALALSVRDEAGDPVAGACFALAPRSDAAADQPVEVCDGDDGSEDGELVLDPVPAGRYVLEETRTPDGRRPAAPEDVAIGDGETATLTVTSQAAEGQPGTLVILVEDESGDPVGETCFALEGDAASFDDVCDQGNDGRLNIPDLPAGEYEVRQVQTAPNREVAADETVTVPPGGREELTVVNPSSATEPTEEPTAEATQEPTEEPTPDEAGQPAIQANDTGRVLVLVRDEDGEAVGGARVELAGAAGGAVRDDGANDEDDGAGRVLLAEVEPGAYALRVDPPDGYEAPQDQTLVVAAGETARVELALQPTAEPTAEPTADAGNQGDEPGTLIILAEDAAGEPLGGACYTVANGGETFGPFCDENANGDVVVTGVSPGEQTVEQTTPPAGAGAPDETEQTPTVEAGEETTLTFVHDGEQATATAAATATEAGDETGSVLVEIEADGRPLAGACVELAGDAETIGPVCDAGVAASGWRAPIAAQQGTIAPADADAEGGRILIEDVPVGAYELSTVDAPDGFAAPPSQTVTVAAGETVEASLSLQADGPTLATVTVLTEDEDGQPLGFACYTLTNPNGVFGPYCDEDGDGAVPIDEVGPGEKTITQTAPPADAGPPQETERTVTVEEGEDAELTFVHGAALGAVEVTAATADGQPVAGGCYELDGPQGYAACDGGDGDADPDPGVVLIEEVAPGDYAVSETEAPEGVEPAAGPEAATVAVGETAAVAFAATPAAETGAVEATTVDPDGTVVAVEPGACFGLSGAAETEPVCDDAAGDANPDPGVVRVDDLAPGDYVLSQTEAPEGYQAADAIAVTVEAGEVAAVAVESAPAPPPSGTLAIVNVDPDGNPIGGGCFALAEAAVEVCDNGPGDADQDPGEVGLGALDAATYTVEQTTPPDGFAAGEPRQVEVVAGEETVEAVVSAPVEAETASVRLETQDADGAPVEGECFGLATDDQDLGTFCDNGDEDADPAPGVVVIEGLAEGVYQAFAVAREGEQPAGQAVGGAERRTVTVRRNQRPTVVVPAAQIPSRTGDLVVAKRDEANRPLAGACFALLDGDGAAVAEVCDNGADDGDGNRGQIRFDDVPAGDYALSETEAPTGYAAAADRAVTVRRGQVERVTVVDEPLPATGTLAVTTVDGAGDALPGACYSLLRGARTVGPLCDDADGTEDGVVAFADLQGGASVLRQTQVPADHTAAGDLALLIEAGQDQAVEVVSAARPGSVLFRKVDEAGQPLAGACFALETADGGGDGYALCDDDASDGDPAPGRVVLGGVVAGDYLASETRAPAGYRAGEDQSVTVAPNRRAGLTFENVPLPPPPRRGNLTVFKVDENDRALPGACFALLQNDEVAAGPRCDGADGARDGTTVFEGVGVGDYALRETQRPAAGYEPIADVPVTIALNETIELAIENRLRPGRVAVRKTDPNGNPLANACFDLEPDGLGPLCTDETGRLAFEGLPPGTYALTETVAPEGFLEADPVEGIEVNPGATTPVDVVDEAAPPPPDTGSIQIVKFFCPAGDGGEGTEFVDSSNPGGGRLARTAGCTPGDATFRLIAAGGEGGPGDFRTGDDGRYQTTLLAGDYDLAELAPDLAGGASEPVTVFVNQLTTVVVLDFVAPPAPAPAAIDVVKYTCAPGFQGTVYADFVEVCAAPANLTNNVTFRLGGATNARAVTGDGGAQGRTAFEGLAAGDYTLREIPPAQAQTAFSFCGLDPDAPDRRRVGTDTALRLEEGQRLTCTWFDVPEALSDTAGSILVQKYGCAVERAPRDYDWFDECDPQGAGVEFALDLRDGDEFAPVATAATDADGLVRFTALDPGTYRLTEVGDAWCHAESDSVNARGEVIVRENERATVWIFNCLGTRRPPNTGAGPLAAAPATVSAPITAAVGGFPVVGAAGHAAGALLGLAWPLLGLAAYAAHRGRRAARAA